MRIRIFQHVPFESPGRLAPALRALGHEIDVVRLDRGEAPALASGEGLVVLGGPMSVNDRAEYPWLVDEKATIASAIRRGAPVLGICLGAQLVAAALGAQVRRNERKEVGWLPVTISTASPFFEAGTVTVFHWHGETFDLPEGATLLASSASCRNQAFSLGPKVLALQFHLEVGPEEVDAMASSLGHDLAPLGPTVHDADRLRRDAREYATEPLLRPALRALFGEA